MYKTLTLHNNDIDDNEGLSSDATIWLDHHGKKEKSSKTQGTRNNILAYSTQYDTNCQQLEVNNTCSKTNKSPKMY